MRLRVIVLIVSFFYSSLLFAQTAATDLSDLLKNMHSLQSHFVQTIVDKKGQVMQKNSGKMALQRPSQFRWEVIKPIRQLIVTNGKRLWIYDPDLEQVTIRKLVKAAGETPAMLLSDETLTLSNEFTIKALNKKDNINWYLLIPKDRGSVIASLKLGFGNNQIYAMHLEDHLGHITQIQFQNVIINKPVSRELFNFKAPPHVDVINEMQS